MVCFANQSYLCGLWPENKWERDKGEGVKGEVAASKSKSGHFLYFETVIVETLIDQLFLMALRCPGSGKRESGRCGASISGSAAIFIVCSHISSQFRVIDETFFCSGGGFTLATCPCIPGYTGMYSDPRGIAGIPGRARGARERRDHLRPPTEEAPAQRVKGDDSHKNDN